MANGDITAFSCGGELVVDSRLVAERLGIEHESFMRTIKKYKDRIEQRFGHLREQIGTVENSVRAKNKAIHVLLTEDQAKALLSKTRQGFSQGDIDLFLTQGMDFSAYLGPKLKRKKRSESSYSKSLALNLEGQREVKTLAGNIDILTSSQVIEVKTVKQWKSALGQVLVYGHYYPSHEKRIHLYGEIQESFLKMIEGHCKKFKVVLTWEA